MYQQIRTTLWSCSLLAALGLASGRCEAQKGAIAQAQQRRHMFQGRVLTPDGRPVPGAVVTLTSGEQVIRRTSSDDQGHFTFQEPGAGRLLVRAEDHRGVSDTATVDEGESARSSEALLLTIRPKQTSTAAADSISFSDGPNFVISGVTDWTAVGGHGSDATLRTSEDLARTTSMLKPAESKPDASSATRLAELDRSLALHPDGYQENFRLGEYYLETGVPLKALEHLKVVLAGNPGSSRLEHDLALASRSLGSPREALVHAQRALQLERSAENYELAGELQEELGDPLGAVQQLQRSAQLSPTEPHYFAWASELLVHRAVWQAADVFEQGSRMYPDSLRMRIGLGSAWFGEARYTEAAQELCAASDLKPSEEEPYLLLSKVGNASPTPLPCVQQRLMRFLRLNPKSAEANYCYAETLLRSGTEAGQRQARDLLLQTVHLKPQHAPALLQLGIIAAGDRQYQQAVHYYTESVAADPDNAEAHFRLASAY